MIPLPAKFITNEYRWRVAKEGDAYMVYCLFPTEKAAREQALKCARYDFNEMYPGEWPEKKS